MSRHCCSDNNDTDVYGQVYSRWTTENSSAYGQSAGCPTDLHFPYKINPKPNSDGFKLPQYKSEGIKETEYAANFTWAKQERKIPLQKNKMNSAILEPVFTRNTVESDTADSRTNEISPKRKCQKSVTFIDES